MTCGTNGVKLSLGHQHSYLLLQQQLSSEAELFVDNVLLESQPTISAITEIELLCWKTASERDMDVLRNFIGDSYVYELEENIRYKAVEMRRNYALKLPDAIIAATALENDLTLITQNLKHFGKIQKLRLINLFDL